MLSVWKETSVEELKALFCMNMWMGLHPLSQYKLYWYQNDFIGNRGVKKQWHTQDYQKLTQYLHVSDKS